VIVSMQKVRILGPRGRLLPVLLVLQDLGAVHLCRPDVGDPVRPVDLTPRQKRHQETLRRALGEAEEALLQLGDWRASTPPTSPPGADGRDGAVGAVELAREVRFVRRTRQKLARLAAERSLHESERERLAGLRRVLEAFADLEDEEEGPTQRFLLVFAGDTARALRRLESALAEAVGDAFRLRTRPLPGGELAVALRVPAFQGERIEVLLAEVGVHELDLPEDTARHDPAEAVEALRRRIVALDEALERLAAQRETLAQAFGPRMQRARNAFHDALLQLDALARTGATAHAFVIEGWLPDAERPHLDGRLSEREGPPIVVETVAREQWSAGHVPVAIQNPRLFRPFEVITRWMPLPRYGTIDPTPYVAVFFPMFFGLILGDVGYGTLLALISGVVRWRSREGSTLRSVAEIGLACAVFSVLFGLLFGELLGDFGHRVLGLEPLAFAREEALVPFLALAVSIGFVHVTLGLVLGAFSLMRSEPRRSLGRGLSALMLLLTAAALLAVTNRLPGAFFTPSVVALLVLFPILIAVEGTIAPIELLSRMSNILSYARIMALGTASVMLAMVANRFVGAAGGAFVGVLFATLFHLVNFALGVFSPTIHALRLHFVEFFGTFYSPGGLVYRPFRHGSPADASAESPA
jgi:V/A-type H+/Na+-transporting ATPase subunit I